MAKKEGFVSSDRLLPIAWKLNNGRFDDGIEDKGVLVGTEVCTRGPYMRQMMERHGVTDYQLDNNLCLVCGVKCLRGQRCPECIAAKRRPEKMA